MYKYEDLFLMYHYLYKDYDEFIEDVKDIKNDNLVEFLDNKVKFSLKDKDFLYKLIYKFISEEEINNEEDSIYIFNRINGFLSKNNIEIDDELLDNLFSNNKFSKVVKMMDGFLSNNPDLYSIINNKLLIESINKYNTISELESSDEDIDLYNLDLYKQYRKMMYKEKLLTPEEERDMLTKIKAGDKSLIPEFVRRNQRLVLSIASKYYGRGVDILDLVQEGNLGLLKAIDKFDLEKGNKFSTYAVFWVKRSVTGYLGDNSRSIRVPLYLKEKICNIKKYINDYDQEYGKYPTDQNVMEKFELNDKDYTLIKRSLCPILSLDSIIQLEDSEVNLMSCIPSLDLGPEELYVEKNGLVDAVDKCIEKSPLTDRELDILLKRCGFIDDKIYKYDEIAKYYGVSTQRIMQIENYAIDKIRRSKTMKNIIDYADKPTAVKNLIKKIKNTDSKK